VREHLAETAPGVTSVVQEQQNGTGHAVRVALDAVPTGETGTVVVVPGDAPLLTTATLHALVDEHETSGAAATVLSSIAPDPTGYGRVIRAEDGKSVLRVVEHKDATTASKPSPRSRPASTPSTTPGYATPSGDCRPTTPGRGVPARGRVDLVADGQLVRAVVAPPTRPPG